MHAFDEAIKAMYNGPESSGPTAGTQQPQTTQGNAFSDNYLPAGINNAAFITPFLQSLPTRSPIPPEQLPHTSTLQHLGTSTSTPFRLAPVGGAAEVSACTAKVAARAAESSSTLGVDDRAAGVAPIGNLRGGRRVWRGLLGEGTIAEAALAACTAVDGLVLDLKGRASVLCDGQR